MLNPLLCRVKRVLLIKEVTLDRLEAIRCLKPFFDLVLPFKKADSIPLLYELAVLGSDAETAVLGTGSVKGPLGRRIDRRYFRLCRIQEELRKLDFKKAAPGVSPEDYVFSQIDFSRYREMGKKDFTLLFPAGLEDFDDEFYERNFGLDRGGIHALIEKSYGESREVFRIKCENPLILSVMQTLETSTEELPLFSGEEIQSEAEKLSAFLGPGASLPLGEILIPSRLFALLVSSLDGVTIGHADGMTTKLFISAGGDLSGTFRPEGKPWTRVLIPCDVKSA